MPPRNQQHPTLPQVLPPKLTPLLGLKGRQNGGMAIQERRVDDQEERTQLRRDQLGLDEQLKIAKEQREQFDHNIKKFDKLNEDLEWPEFAVAIRDLDINDPDFSSKMANLEVGYKHAAFSEVGAKLVKSKKDLAAPWQKQYIEAAGPEGGLSMDEIRSAAEYSGGTGEFIQMDYGKLSEMRRNRNSQMLLGARNALGGQGDILQNTGTGNVRVSPEKAFAGDQKVMRKEYNDASELVLGALFDESAVLPGVPNLAEMRADFQKEMDPRTDPQTADMLRQRRSENVHNIANSMANTAGQVAEKDQKQGGREATLAMRLLTANRKRLKDLELATSPEDILERDSIKKENTELEASVNSAASPSVPGAPAAGTQAPAPANKVQDIFSKIGAKPPGAGVQPDASGSPATTPPTQGATPAAVPAPAPKTPATPEDGFRKLFNTPSPVEKVNAAKLAAETEKSDRAVTNSMRRYGEIFSKKANWHAEQTRPRSALTEYGETTPDSPETLAENAVKEATRRENEMTDNLIANGLPKSDVPKVKEYIKTTGEVPKFEFAEENGKRRVIFTFNEVKPPVIQNTKP